jgi:hypothetical protein
MICEANDIEHRLIKPKHSWTNDQVERMNSTIKEATVKRLHYESHEQLRCASPTLRQPTISLAGQDAQWPHAVRVHRKIRTLEPDRFIVDPIDQMPGLNS